MPAFYMNAESCFLPLCQGRTQLSDLGSDTIVLINTIKKIKRETDDKELKKPTAIIVSRTTGRGRLLNLGYAGAGQHL